MARGEQGLALPRLMARASTYRLRSRCCCAEWYPLRGAERARSRRHLLTPSTAGGGVSPELGR